MTTPSDDECIALAMLHGAEIHKSTNFEPPRWFILPSEPKHPFNKFMVRTGGRYSRNSAAEIAREYCKFYKLIPEDEHDHRTQLRSGHAA